MSFLPKALRSSQAPERGAQSLPSSGTQPFVAPGTPGISAKPLGLKQEGWAPVRSLHGLEQGAQERPRGLSILRWAGSSVFLLWYRDMQEGRRAKTFGI